MKALWIMLLCSLIYFSYSKIESRELPIDRFPFSDIQMTWPEYAWTLCTRITYIGFAWSQVALNSREKKYLTFAALVISGWGIDFCLEANRGWFHLFGMVISYEAFIFVALCLVIVKAYYDGER